MNKQEFKYNLFLLIILVFYISGYSYSQKKIYINLKATVIDYNSKDIIPNTEIIFINVNDATEYSGCTDTNGFCEFELPLNTFFIILLSHPDYLTIKTYEYTGYPSIEFTRKYDLKKIDTNEITKIDNIFFEHNTYKLRPESFVSLDVFVSLLNINSDLKIQILTNCDPRMTDINCDRMNSLKTKSISEYLTSKGIDPDRIIYHDNGKTVPYIVTKSCTYRYPFNEGQVLSLDFIKNLATDEEKKQCWNLNARVEYRIIGKMRKK